MRIANCGLRNRNLRIEWFNDPITQLRIDFMTYRHYFWRALDVD